MLRGQYGGKCCFVWLTYFFGDFNSLSFLDLYLIHWPDAHVPGKSNREVRAETWTAMEELYEEGDVIMKSCRGRRNWNAL